MRKFKSRLKELYIREAFFPTLLGALINPFYFARKGLVGHITDLGSNIYGKTLDIGCGTKPYTKLYQSTEYVGLEIDTPTNRKHKKAEFFYDGVKFPFEDSTFDSAVSNQVFEHVFNPDCFLNEIIRILKPGGYLLMTIPFVWDEHEQPYDFARYSSFGIKVLLENHGFIIVEQRKSVNDIRVIFQLLNAYLYKKLNTNNFLVNTMTTLVFIAPFNIVGELLSMIFPKNNDLFLDNVVLAKKVN